MNITNQIHEICKNYFDLTSSESKEPLSKVCLTALKALSIFTIVIPLFMGAAYVFTVKPSQPNTHLKKIDAAPFLVSIEKSLPKITNQDECIGVYVDLEEDIQKDISQVLEG